MTYIVALPVTTSDQSIISTTFFFHTNKTCMLYHNTISLDFQYIHVLNRISHCDTVTHTSVFYYKSEVFENVIFCFRSGTFLNMKIRLILFVIFFSQTGITSTRHKNSTTRETALIYLDKKDCFSQCQS